jgi:thioredoxin 1
MSGVSKIIIVATLVVAVGAVLAMKGREKPVQPDGNTVTTVPSAESIVQPVQAASDPVVKKLPQLIDLGANKCIPCKAMKPILDELRTTYAGAFDVVFIDVWENPAKAKQYGINMIPTQIFLDAGGKELFRHEGFFSREGILAKWKEMGVDTAVAAK